MCGDSNFNVNKCRRVLCLNSLMSYKINVHLKIVDI